MGVRNLGLGSRAAPNSQVVQSDDEFLAPYQQRIDSAIYNWNNTPTEQEFLRQEIPRLTGQDPNIIKSWIDRLYDPNEADKRWYETAIGNLVTNGNVDTRASVVPEYYKYDEGEQRMKNAGQIQSAQAAFDTAKADRLENSQRQQTAYNQLQGGSYFGGMMNEGYSLPFSGQFAGNGPGGGPGQSTPGGIDPSSPASAWGSFNSFNPRPKEDQFRAGAWGSGSAFSR